MPATAPTASDPLMKAVRRGPLGPFFAPRTIAVIGASERAGSVGRALVENLFEFDGSVFPVNPRRATVLGLPAFSALAAVPEPVDLAVIATPAHTVPGVIAACAEAGVPAAIVVSAGFRECGPKGAELERQVLRPAQAGGVRVIGPNCLGLMAPHRRLNATFAGTLARPGDLAFLSQSGALCTAVLDWSTREQVGFSALVSVGAMVDVAWAELITTLGDDPYTHSILLYLESIGDARAFLSAAREVAYAKPIIVVKAGRTSTGARAAASHTGALTGSDAVADAAFRRAGVLRVDSIEDLFDMAEVLAKQPRPRGRRLGIVTNAGGPAALAADRLVLRGGETATLAPATLAALDRALPAAWSHGNPVDILGDADEGRYVAAVEAVAADPGTDGVLVVLTPQAMTDALATAQRLRTWSARAGGKPVLASWMGATAVAAGERELNEGGIPTFAFPDRAAQAFASMWQYSANLAGLYETPMLRERAKPPEASPEVVEPLLRAVRQAGRVILTESESKELLAAFGIPVVRAQVARSEDEAVAVATQVGFPVAIKLHSETITHKARVGGVRLNVRDAAEARAAWREIRHAVTERVGAPHFQGVAVGRMVPPDGWEFILGSSVDPQFGPVILFGAGGRLVEACGDHAIGLPPLTSTLARRMMEQTRVFSALAQARNGRQVDLAQLEDVVVRFSQLVAELRWIKEIDVNPLFVSGGEIVALDARVILHDPGTPESSLPRLAIRPYPQHYATPAVLADGTAILLRSIRPQDEPLMVRFHESLSEQSVYFRYFSHLSLAQRTAHARLARICTIDHDREVVLVAVHEEARTGSAIIGVGRLCKRHGKNEAEFAVIVADAWQRRHVGTVLLRKLVEIGREEGLERISGTVLGENLAMRRLCARVGFTLRHAPDANEFEASLALRASRSQALRRFCQVLRRARHHAGLTCAVSGTCWCFRPMKTILAAIDFSPVSRDVVDHAVALSRAVDGRVTVLHAVEPPAIATDLTSVVGEALRLMAEVERTSRRQLQRMQRRWAERGVTVEVMCRQGFPVPLIAAVAKQLEADYIVLGSHGHSALHDLVAGSTTNGVLKRADCPVVVVPARLARPELRPRKMPAARRRRKEVT